MTEQAEPPTLKAVKAALQSGDQAAAVALAREALNRGETHPLFLNLRAFWLEGQNRHVDALADLAQAVALAPEDGAIQNAHGLALGRLGHAAEAAAAFRVATDRQPGLAPAWFNLGYASEQINDLAAARTAYERAALLAPDWPQPSAYLAVLAVRRGDWAAARAEAGRALDLDAGRTGPAIMADRAIAAADIAQKQFDDAERRIAALLAAPAIGWEDRYLAAGLLGDLRHAQGRYGEAFDAYAAGGAVARKANTTRFAPNRSALDVIGWLTPAFASVAPWPRTAATAPSAAASAAPESEGGVAAHAFLLGFPRSGTTLLEQALAAHPDVVSLEEQEALADSARVFMAGPGGLAPLAALGEADRLAYAARYWDRVRSFGVDPAARYFIDKLPFNTMKLPLVSRLFPDARVLYALRDPRDVVLSCLRQRFRVGAYTFELLTLEAAARFYAAMMRLGTLYADKLPLNLRFVRHEDLVEDFDGELQGICAFLGIDWRAGMRDFAHRPGARPVATPSAVQLKGGLSRAGLAQWRNYRDQLAPILPVLAPWVERFGYPED